MTRRAILAWIFGGGAAGATLSRLPRFNRFVHRRAKPLPRLLHSGPAFFEDPDCQVPIGDNPVRQLQAVYMRAFRNVPIDTASFDTAARICAETVRIDQRG